MEALLLQFNGFGLIATYAIVFFGMFIEGETFLILAGILVRGQVIDFLNTILVAFCAVILHDIGYWVIGMKLRELNKTQFLGINVEKMEKIFKKMNKREGLYIFVSKFAWGMNRFVLLSAGYFRTPFKKLIMYTVPAAFVWSTTFVSLGYMFADRAELWKKDIKTMAILTGIFFIGMICVEYLIGRSIKEESQFPNGEK